MCTVEFMKVKRHYLLLVSISMVFLSALLAVFQIMGSDGAVESYAALTEGIVWNNVTLFFPLIITFFGGFLINREYIDDTWKNNLIISSSYPKIIRAKIFTVGIITIVFSVLSFSFTLVFAIVLKYPIMISEIVSSFFVILLTALTCFISVVPIIVIFTRRKNLFLVGTGVAFIYGFCGIFIANTKFVGIYPPAVGLALTYYKSGTSSSASSILIMVLCLCISAFLLKYVKGGVYD
ncbi:ABC transporter permease [Dorea longicatena]|uniref:ABC transporter permease n=1 Tax=Dorea longicatena TaxID=88431 RepID=UPI000420D3EE|nr:ABC transporter permease [Dorea longicatena]